MKLTLQRPLWKYTHICSSFFSSIPSFLLSSQRATDYHLSDKGIKHILQMSSDCLYRYMCACVCCSLIFPQMTTRTLKSSLKQSLLLLLQLWHSFHGIAALFPPLRVGSSEITKLFLNQSRKEKFINLCWLLIKDQT